jgi:hypothetical protein
LCGISKFIWGIIVVVTAFIGPRCFAQCFAVVHSPPTPLPQPSASPSLLLSTLKST